MTGTALPAGCECFYTCDHWVYDVRFSKPDIGYVSNMNKQVKRIVSAGKRAAGTTCVCFGINHTASSCGESVRNPALVSTLNYRRLSLS